MLSSMRPPVLSMVGGAVMLLAGGFAIFQEVHKPSLASQITSGPGTGYVAMAAGNGGQAATQIFASSSGASSIQGFSEAPLAPIIYLTPAHLNSFGSSSAEPAYWKV